MNILATSRVEYRLPPFQAVYDKERLQRICPLCHDRGCVPTRDPVRRDCSTALAERQTNHSLTLQRQRRACDEVERRSRNDKPRPRITREQPQHVVQLSDDQ